MIREIFQNLTVLPMVVGAVVGGTVIELIGYSNGFDAAVHMSIAYIVFGFHKDVKWY